MGITSSQVYDLFENKKIPTPTLPFILLQLSWNYSSAILIYQLNKAAKTGCLSPTTVLRKTLLQNQARDLGRKAK